MYEIFIAMIFGCIAFFNVLGMSMNGFPSVQIRSVLPLIAMTQQVFKEPTGWFCFYWGHFWDLFTEGNMDLLGLTSRFL